MSGTSRRHAAALWSEVRELVADLLVAALDGPSDDLALLELDGLSSTRARPSTEEIRRALPLPENWSLASAGTGVGVSWRTWVLACSRSTAVMVSRRVGTAAQAHVLVLPDAA